MTRTARYSSVTAERAPTAASDAGGAPDEGSAGRSGGRLFVVATPIGNLGDVTLRALEILRSVPLVAAEDTRLTRRLFARHAISTRLLSYHARNAAMRGPELIAHLHGGADLALVTDAGTPGVSDPGEGLVAAWVEAGGVVVPIPGPSAVLAAVVASGIAGPRWSFEGFLPRSGRERGDRLGRIARDERGTVLFEAPGRVPATLGDLAGTCGDDRPAAICRELTKIHEEFVRGPLGHLAQRARAGEISLRGEFVIVVGAWQGASARAAVGRQAGRSGGSEALERENEARAEVDRLVAMGTARGEAARRVAAATGIPRRRLYGGPSPDRP